jgi:hypothetical protein
LKEVKELDEMLGGMGGMGDEMVGRFSAGMKGKMD